MAQYWQNLTDTLIALPGLWWALAFVLGACVGSFLNVVVWRLPIMLNDEWNAAAAEQLQTKPPASSGLTLSIPHSHCPKCKNSLKWHHNIPLLGWLALGGRCGYCKTGISARYPVVELIGGLAGLVCAYQFGVTTQAISAMALLWVLLTITLIDWDTQFIPDVISGPLLWSGLLLNVSGTFVSLQDAVIGAALGYGLLWSCFKLFKLVTGKDGMGYGDFKLLAALGAWMGFQSIGIIILIASISGASFGIGQRLFGRLSAGQAMPFGPWLALGGTLYLLWGPAISQVLLAP